MHSEVKDSLTILLRCKEVEQRVQEEGPIMPNQRLKSWTVNGENGSSIYLILSTNYQ